LTKFEEVHTIGSFSFDPAAGILKDAAGRVVALRPQTAKVLAVLASRRGDLVTKDDLMREVWADTHVTDDSLVQCISEIRKVLGPIDSEHLKTVPKQGYKLAPANRVPPLNLSSSRRSVAILGAVISIAMVAIVAWVSLRSPAPVRAVQSIAVMPFANIGSDDSYAYFSKGVAEDLIVSLSKLSDLRVVARSASFSIASHVGDPREIARELKVSHLLDGSVRRMGDNLRLTAALVDGRTGQTIWAESYDGSLDDIFQFQNTVLSELVRVLSVRLSRSERERLGVRGTTNIAAYDWYLRGLQWEGFLTKTANREAESAFAEAIRLDPKYAAAHAHMSMTLTMQAEYGWAENTETTIVNAMKFARRAVDLSPELPFARFALGRLMSRKFVGNIAGALSEFRAAVDVDPNYVDAYAFMSLALIFDGRAKEALPVIEMAFKRNPIPQFWYYIPLGLSNYFLGNYDAAKAALEKAHKTNPKSPHPMRVLIATYGQLGDADEAQWIGAEYETLGYVAKISDILQKSPIQNPTYLQNFAEGLRMAGLEE